MYTRLRFLAHYRGSPQVCISLHNFKYAGSTPAFYPQNCCDSHSSPHSGNPEGIFIALNFRCFPFPHGVCLRTGRFPRYLVGEGLTSLWPLEYHGSGPLTPCSSLPQGHQWRLAVSCSGFPAHTPPSSWRGFYAALRNRAGRAPSRGADRSPFPFLSRGRRDGGESVFFRTLLSTLFSCPTNWAESPHCV